GSSPVKTRRSHGKTQDHGIVEPRPLASALPRILPCSSFASSRWYRFAHKVSFTRAQPRMLLRITDQGLYCEAGDFFIDPWEGVDRAVITHAHGDHARWGSRVYLGAEEGERVLRTRLG